MAHPPQQSFTAAWLSRDLQATRLLPTPDAVDLRISTTRRAAERPVAPALIEVLRAQDAALLQDAARTASLDTLARGGAAVVVTGQQTGLFGGPLYSVYKAASAIVAARQLSSESGVPVVPLFWLQTEDHDFPEIAHCLVPRPGAASEAGPLRLAIGDGGVEPRVSVAGRVLGDDVEECLAALESALAGLPHAAETIGMVRAAYRPGRSLAGAFSSLMARVFAGTGLLFLDPRQAVVAELLAPLYARAIEGAAGIAHALDARTAALHTAGFEAQVHVRPGSPLLFLHAPDAAGPRFRLDPEAPHAVDATTGAAGAAPPPARYLLVGDEQHRAITRADLLDIAYHHPLRLSTSALLRPIAQDSLLPVAAYVGGPGEIAYLVQVAALYRCFDLPPSLVIHRGRLRCTDARCRALLDELGLTPADTERPRAELAARLAALHKSGTLPSPEALRQELGAGLLARLEAARSELVEVDPRLARSVNRTRVTVDRALDRFTRAYARGLAEKDDVGAARLARLDRVLGLLQPGGEPQERALSLPWFTARAGIDAFTRVVLETVVPFDAALRELSL